MSRPQEWNFQFDGNLPRNQTPPRPAATENSKPLLGHSQNEISHVSNHARQDNASFHLPNKRSGGWSWEFLSLAIIVGCFGGIITLLLALQNKPVPDWPSGITVNAVLSVLVTVMKGATGIIIAECLSQLKWRWFQRERRLIDFIIWDEASRGAWGARRLLLTPRGWFLGYLGAFAFLSAFIIGPTIQQTVEVRVRQVEMSINASVPLCNSSYYSIVGLGSGAGGNKLNLPMIGTWTVRG